MNKFEVQNFLNQFKDKMKIWDVIFLDNRKKNVAALTELEIAPFERLKILEKLKAEDYSEGPLEDKLEQIADMWVFGKLVKKQEVYIKISMGYPESNTICISFHIAEHPMQYPFK